MLDTYITKRSEQCNNSAKVVDLMSDIAMVAKVLAFTIVQQWRSDHIQVVQSRNHVFGPPDPYSDLKLETTISGYI